jgi:hypothetical protein
MTNATAAPNPIAAATAIAEAARYRADTSSDRRGTAAVIAMIAGVGLSVAAAGAMLMSPAIPIWCGTHGCPSPMTIPTSCSFHGSC